MMDDAKNTERFIHLNIDNCKKLHGLSLKIFVFLLMKHVLSTWCTRLFIYHFWRQLRSKASARLIFVFAIYLTPGICFWSQRSEPPVSCAWEARNSLGGSQSAPDATSGPQHFARVNKLSLKINQQEWLFILREIPAAAIIPSAT